MRLERWDPARDGALGEAALRAKLERRGYAVSRWVYAPGTRFEPHTHDVDKLDAVVSGRLRMTLPDGEVVLGAGDVLAVPGGTLHAAEVVGEESVVSLDATRI